MMLQVKSDFHLPSQVDLGVSRLDLELRGQVRASIEFQTWFGMKQKKKLENRPFFSILLHKRYQNFTMIGKNELFQAFE